MPLWEEQWISNLHLILAERPRSNGLAICKNFGNKVSSRPIKTQCCYGKQVLVCSYFYTLYVNTKYIWQLTDLTLSWRITKFHHCEELNLTLCFIIKFQYARGFQLSTISTPFLGNFINTNSLSCSHQFPLLLLNAACHCIPGRKQTLNPISQRQKHSVLDRNYWILVF